MVITMTDNAVYKKVVCRFQKKKNKNLSQTKQLFQKENQDQ